MSANRSEFLKNCVARLYAAEMDYVQSRNDEIGPKHAFWNAAEALIKALDDPYSDIPADCRRIFTAVMGDGQSTGFKAAWNGWARREEVASRPTWKPSAAVWRAYRDVGNAMKAEAAVPQQMVDKVADLVAQGVDDSQIAYIYQRFSRNGARDVAWVQQMKAHPELNTDETRRVATRKRAMSRAEWESFAAKLAATPRIQQVRAMLERGEDPHDTRSSRFAEEFALREFESQPLEELPAEWGQEDTGAMSESAAEAWERDQAEASWGSHSKGAHQPSITLEQRAVMLLDDGIDDSEIVRRLNISGQKLGAIKRRAADIRETLPQLEPVEV